MDTVTAASVAVHDYNSVTFMDTASRDAALAALFDPAARPAQINGIDVANVEVVTIAGGNAVVFTLVDETKIAAIPQTLTCRDNSTAKNMILFHVLRRSVISGSAQSEKIKNDSLVKIHGILDNLETVVSAIVIKHLLGVIQQEIASAAGDTPESLSIVKAAAEALDSITQKGDDTANGLCLTPDSLIYLADGNRKQLIDIKEGDVVLSLNKETDRFESHRVVGLLDMGTKSVYRMTTESGKTLKTTANHPYLVKKENGKWKMGENLNPFPTPHSPLFASKWLKLRDLKARDEIACLADEQAVENETDGRINGYALSSNYGDDQYTLRLARKPEIQKLPIALAFSIASFFFWLDKNTTSKQYWPYNGQKNSQIKRKLLKEITSQPNSENRFSNICNYFGDKFSSTSIYDIHRRPMYHTVKNLSRFIYEAQRENGKKAWETENSSASSSIVWDKIVSIEYIGDLLVYDIEVEGTHNFVAEGIVAHNTYVNGEHGSTFLEYGIYDVSQAVLDRISKEVEGGRSKVEEDSPRELTLSSGIVLRSTDHPSYASLSVNDKATVMTSVTIHGIEHVAESGAVMELNTALPALQIDENITITGDSGNPVTYTSRIEALMGLLRPATFGGEARNDGAYKMFILREGLAQLAELEFLEDLHRSRHLNVGYGSDDDIYYDTTYTEAQHQKLLNLYIIFNMTEQPYTITHADGTSKTITIRVSNIPEVQALFDKLWAVTRDNELLIKSGVLPAIASNNFDELQTLNPVWQGRTMVIEDPNDSNYYFCYKFANSNDPNGEKLQHEYEMMLKAKEFGIKDTPEPINEPYQFTGDLTNLSTGISQNRWVLEYRCPKTARQYITEEYTDIPQADRKAALQQFAQKNMEDWLTWFKNGYIHTSLTPLTHDSSAGEGWSCDHQVIGIST